MIEVSLARRGRPGFRANVYATAIATIGGHPRTPSGGDGEVVDLGPSCRDRLGQRTGAAGGYVVHRFSVADFFVIPRGGPLRR